VRRGKASRTRAAVAGGDPSSYAIYNPNRGRQRRRAKGRREGSLGSKPVQTGSGSGRRRGVAAAAMPGGLADGAS
jgi:hypothetical protein